jgi:V8-like Glu-specific endopeptidase
MTAAKAPALGAAAVRYDRKTGHIYISSALSNSSSLAIPAIAAAQQALSSAPSHNLTAAGPLAASQGSAADAGGAATAGQQAGARRLHLTLGVDGRRHNVGPKLAFPYNAIGLLEIFDSWGNYAGSCSAALVGPSSILTAGHCVHSDPLDGFPAGWYDWWRFSPGRACKAGSCKGGSASPLGSVWDSGVVTTYKQWTAAGDSAFDLAVIRLDRRFSMWMGLDSNKWPSSTGYTAG